LLSCGSKSAKVCALELPNVTIYVGASSKVILCMLELTLILEIFISGRVAMCIDLPSLQTHYLLAYH